MTTLSWLEAMLFAVVFVGTVCAHVGYRLGRDDERARRESMRRHPSNGGWGQDRAQ
jgi:hypothetical protein